MPDQDARTPPLGTVTAAYGSWAPAYIERFASADLAEPEDRAEIAAWSASLRGPVLDAGCGPGHWSAYLRSTGLEVEGVDATPEFVEHARSTHPEIRFRLGDLRSLDVAEGSLGGVLAWFSLIHADPEDVPTVLERLARALRPGGSLLIGFFSGADLRPFDHRVVSAWAWPVDDMAHAVDAAGLTVMSRHDWTAPKGRSIAAIVAVAPPGTDARERDGMLVT